MSHLLYEIHDSLMTPLDWGLPGQHHIALGCLGNHNIRRLSRYDAHFGRKIIIFCSSSLRYNPLDERNALMACKYESILMSILLEILLDDKLLCKEQIDAVCNKRTESLDIMRRMINYFHPFVMTILNVLIYLSCISI